MKDRNNMMIFPNLKTVIGGFILSALPILQSVIAELQQADNEDNTIGQTVIAQFKYVEGME